MPHLDAAAHVVLRRWRRELPIHESLATRSDRVAMALARAVVILMVIGGGIVTVGVVGAGLAQILPEDDPRPAVARPEPVNDPTTIEGWQALLGGMDDRFGSTEVYSLELTRTVATIELVDDVTTPAYSWRRVGGWQPADRSRPVAGLIPIELRSLRDDQVAAQLEVAYEQAGLDPQEEVEHRIELLRDGAGLVVLTVELSPRIGERVSRRYTLGPPQP
ncbi:hypothetical protein ACHAAC_07435 [Aeromicrobium sp. CF4.19]|uniref:hypothetical protein n=1 Tax=Aeromicrobium sp. CF4.19 TaxID=3373082 RepID=UPI003EE4B55C